ncbi:unnamed protein product [Cyclocybe aegerita]|uniref:Uncharacterized protein n=1 Tax=Cyclocybe aegerita TaxID=1973307 RepID=A0A8S0X5J2_CYCAE|nr:unnamed protein product [Cyclocybe aegerita]
MLNFQDNLVLKDNNTMMSIPLGPSTSTYSATVVDMPFVAPIALANPRAHRLLRVLLWTSIPLCCIILTDAIFMLYITSTRSFYLAPTAFCITMLHHLVVLVVSYFERRGRVPLGDGIPVTVHMGAIFGAWLYTTTMNLSPCIELKCDLSCHRLTAMNRSVPPEATRL